MGLIKAALGSVSTVLADQWREYFYCDSMSENVLVVKGQKRTSNRSSNIKASDNIISNGSVVVVNEGQCMMIVDQGAIVEFTAEPGEFTWNSSSEPSIFYGGLGQGIKGSWELFKRRFTFGADTGRDQRVYYFNLKEIIGNLYGTTNPIPFRLVDNNIGLDMDVSVRCNGEYSYKITDPMLFYKNVCGNVTEMYTRQQLDSKLKSEFLTALQPAFAKISALGIRYYELSAHTEALAVAMDEALSEKWSALRGISVVSVSVNSVTIPPEDQKMIQNLQRSAVYRNASMAGAAMVDAQAEAMKFAAKNENGPMTAFMGMSMAQQAGGLNANALFEMGQKQQSQNPVQPAAEGWVCKCGEKNSGKFCMECGSPKPEDDSWTCSCGSVNEGNFCPECGSKKPGGLYRCNKCGWEPQDLQNPPKFCPECGDKFDNSDMQ